MEHSEEFKDVVSRFPTIYNNMIVYALLAFVILGVLIGWGIDSPEMLIGPAKVTAEHPPITLIAESNGKLKLLKFQPQQYFSKDIYLAIIENLGNEEQILKLKDTTEKYRDQPEKIKLNAFSFAAGADLGDLEAPYMELISVLYEVEYFNNNNEYNIDLAAYKNRAQEYKALSVYIQQLATNKSKEIEILNGKLQDDSILFKKNMLAKTMLEDKTVTLLREKSNLENYHIEAIKNTVQLSDTKENIEKLLIKKGLKGMELKHRMLDAFFRLSISLNKWEKLYVIKMPVKGKVDYLNFISEHQYVKIGEPIFSVLPDNNKIMGQVLIPSEGAGKVKVGQEVHIRLNAFPANEFGKLTGTVRSISLIANEAQYLVMVELPQGLKSDVGAMLTFGDNMDGSAEIISSKRKLISRMFDKITRIFENNFIPSNNSKQNADNEKNPR